MMHLLKSIAYDVAVCMSQLFEYYFYTVYVFFAAENVSELISVHHYPYHRTDNVTVVYHLKISNFREMFPLRLFRMLSFVQL
jgi:hypothetical protein